MQFAISARSQAFKGYNYMNYKKPVMGIIASLLLAMNPVYAQAVLKPAAIMDRVNGLDMGDNASSHLTMTTINEKGEKKVTELQSFRKSLGPNKEEVRNIMFYTAPLPLKNIGFLTIDFKDPKKLDDRYMYSPALKKIKRVASQDKRMSFMNSDFSYADMTVRNSDNYIFFNSVKESTIDGQKVWVFEGSPVREEDVGDEGYAKTLFHVRQDDFILIRTINYLRKGNKEKQMDISHIEKIDGYWVFGEIKMVTRKAGKELSSTVLKTTDAKFNQPVADAFFNVEQLKIGLK